MVIAIDGPGGVGKSTVARAVAKRLGLAYLDTGATYRAATLVVLDAGVSPDDGDAAVTVVDQAEFGYSMGTIYVEGRDIGREVRSAEVTANSSTVSAHPAIRERIVSSVFSRTWKSVFRFFPVSKPPVRFSAVPWVGTESVQTFISRIERRRRPARKNTRD